MGIFDALYAQTPQGEQLRGGLLGMGMGLLGGSVGNGGQFAPALAQGFAGFQGGMQNAQKSQLQQQQMAQQQMMTALKAKQLQGEITQQEQFGKFFGGGQSSGDAQTMPVGTAGDAMNARIQQAINSGNPMLMDWGFRAQTAQKEKPRRTQYDQNTGLLIDLDSGSASPVMGPGGALQPKDDLVWDSARGGFVNKKNMAFNPAIGPDGKPVPAQNILEKPLNETQSKDLLFGTRAIESNKIIGDLTPTVSLVGAAANEWRPPDWVPFGGAMAAGINKASSPETQQFNQAKRDFVNAVLRKESGAVISEEEFANAERQYFPQPGDTQEVIQQKSANRDLAANGILAGVPQDRRGSLSPVPVSASPKAAAGMASPRTAQDYQSLPSGAVFQAPDGSIRRKP